MKPFKNEDSTSIRNSSSSRITPKFSLLLLLSISLLLLSILVKPTESQEYMSDCDKVSKPCALDGFFSCISGQCQCRDPLNQIYDDAMSQCVIMAGRNCNLEGEPNTDFVDPRTFSTFPNCGRNGKCDPTTLTCQCKKGFFLNGANGTCDSSFGRSCSSDDAIVFSAGSIGGRDNDTIPSTFVGCDTTLGLRCDNGKCDCGDQSVWQIGQGCVDRSQPFNGNSNITISYVKEDTTTMTPFQRLVDTYTRALIDANNYYYLPQNPEGNNSFAEKNFNLGTMAYPDDLLYNLTWGEQNKTDEYFIGDRNQFPNNYASTNNPIWNLLAQQQQQQQNNTNSDNFAKVQLQAAQLQSLLSQQQRLQQLINQLNPAATLGQGTVASSSSSSSTQQQQQFNVAPAPSGNYLNGQGQQGGYYPGQSQASPNQNYYQQHWTAPQQPLLGGGAFPLLRWFRNFVDPLKRRLFPNLADAVNSIPSPLFIAARTTHALLPVLRAFDQQFAPMLESVIELTRPRPRPTTQAPPPMFFNPQQQWNGNAFQNLQPQYQNQQQASLYGPRSQQQSFLGRSLWNNGRNGRMRNGNRDDNSLNRRLWWG